MGFFEDLANFGSSKKIYGQPGQPTGSQAFGQASSNMASGLNKVPIMVGGVFSPASMATGGLSELWSGLGTGGKVAVGAGGGLLAGWGITSLFGGKAPVSGGAGGAGGTDYSSKKADIPVTVNPNVYTYPTTNQYDYSTTYSNISNSPYASISNKKAMSASATANVTPDFTVTPNISQLGGGGSGGSGGSAAAGTDWATLAAIAGVIIVGYGFVTRRKGK